MTDLLRLIMEMLGGRAFVGELNEMNTADCSMANTSVNESTDVFLTYECKHLLQRLREG